MKPSRGFLSKLLSNRSGMTLVEVIVAVSILTTVAVMVSTATFQIVSAQRTWRDNVLAVKDLRHAQSWFAGDAMNATVTSLADPAASTSVTLEWAYSPTATHTAMYFLSGTSTPFQLVRRFDGNEIEVARRVVSAGFSRSGKTLTFDLDVQAADDQTNTSTLNTYMRNMP